PTPISDQIATASTSTGFANVLLPPSSAFYPHALAAAAGVDGQPLNVRWRTFDNRNTTDDNPAWQAIVGVKGTAFNWDWDGSFNYSENKVKETLNNGWFYYSKLLPLLNSGTVNLFGPNT